MYKDAAEAFGLMQKLDMGGAEEPANEDFAFSDFMRGFIYV